LANPLFIVLAGLAFGYSGYRFKILFQMMKAHQGKVDPKQRFNLIPQRVQTVIVNVLGQQAVMRKPAIGIAHATIFWGFIIISIGTVEQFLGTLYQGASFEFIGDTAYHALLATQDTFTFAILLAVGFAAYRRFAIRPPGLGKSRDAECR
jgi:hypothetical protein